LWLLGLNGWLFLLTLIVLLWLLEVLVILILRLAVILLRELRGTKLMGPLYWRLVDWVLLEHGYFREWLEAIHTDD